jgi:alkylation response protein AidB-like acyl-CoA dehydrogenase
MRQLLDRIVAELRQRGQLGDPAVRQRVAELHARTEILRLTSYRGLSAIQKYGQPGPESSLTKLMWSRTNQEIAQFAIDAIGPEALAADSPWSFDVLRARGNSIEGGTTEILKNIVAERVLGLPKGR